MAVNGIPGEFTTGFTYLDFFIYRLFMEKPMARRKVKMFEIGVNMLKQQIFICKDMSGEGQDPKLGPSRGPNLLLRKAS